MTQARADIEQAQAALRRVLRDYPASPARERATKLLEQTGEPLAGDRGP
jgi:outer membrane protein assembly factor BamD (BamD/ComL family)